MAKSKLKVTGLELETKDGKKVSLKLNEARDLYEQLDELFGKEVPGPAVYIDRWLPYWNQPWITWYGPSSISQGSYTNAGNKAVSSNTTVLLKTVGQESGLQISYTGIQSTASSIAA